MIFEPKPNKSLRELAEESERLALTMHNEGRLRLAHEHYAKAAERWRRVGQHEGSADAFRRATAAWVSASSLAKQLAEESTQVANMLEGH